MNCSQWDSAGMGGISDSYYGVVPRRPLGLYRPGTSRLLSGNPLLDRNLTGRILDNLLDAGQVWRP